MPGVTQLGSNRAALQVQVCLLPNGCSFHGIVLPLRRATSPHKYRVIHPTRIIHIDRQEHLSMGMARLRSKGLSQLLPELPT